MKIAKISVFLCVYALFFGGAKAATATPADLAAPQNGGQNASPPISAKAADKKLAKDVRIALYKSRKVSTGHVTVISRSGRVTLIGSVPDERQIAAAGDQARSVDGVRDVDNRLTFSLPGH